MSTSVQTVTLIMAAADSRTLSIRGKSFEVVDASGPLDVDLYYDGAAVADITGALAGHFVKGVEFNTVNIRSASAQTVVVMVAGEEAGSRRAAGNVGINNTTEPRPAAWQQAAGTVTTTASSAVIPALTGRKFLEVQNKSTSGTIWLHWSATATQANGVRIGPGEVWTAPAVMDAAPSLIGDIASNPDVVYTSGA